LHEDAVHVRLGQVGSVPVVYPFLVQFYVDEFLVNDGCWQHKDAA
jgi:hypothetical protein